MRPAKAIEWIRDEGTVAVLLQRAARFYDPEQGWRDGQPWQRITRDRAIHMLEQLPPRTDVTVTWMPVGGTNEERWIVALWHFPRPRVRPR